tara:strand:+ start:24 stop:845 length:822 start_codon:yes stop_codon:yes gene_type:complete
VELFTKIRNLKFQDIPDLQGWIGDAKFGLQQLSNYLDKNEKYDILEIGCGIGILLACLQEQYPKIITEGIEPYKGGFDRLKATKNLIPKSIGIRNLKFEDFKPRKKYDIIYSVNVFEHLLDWKLYIDKTKEWLKPQGVNIILCPNYSFPYESHFKIPILLNKKLTYLFFKNKINKFEKENKSLGLWHSLNFIKMRDIKNYCIKNNLKFKYHNQIFNDIINRLDDDKEFKKRQSFVGFFAKNLQKFGVLNLLNNNIFHSFHPYMKIEITKSGSD